jgi:hypothetical protein
MKLGSKYLPNVKVPVPNFIQVIFVFILVSFGWIFFRAANLSDAYKVIHQCFSGFNWRHPGLTTAIVSRTNFTIILASLATLIFCDLYVFGSNGYQRFILLNSRLRMACYILLCLTILTFGVFNDSKFIYFQF